MKASMILTTIMIAAGLSGCAHSVMRGSVAMKTSDNEAHVCLGKGEVAVGDRVALFKNVCVGTGGTSGDRGGPSCEKKEVGMGSVQKILNQHYSVVKFDQGVQFDEGSVVEKR